jgi:hypothetical protein
MPTYIASALQINLSLNVASTKSIKLTPTYFLFSTRSQHCKENPIYLFPEKEFLGLSPNFHIHIYFIICTVIPTTCRFCISTENYIVVREDWMLRGPRLSSFWVPRNLSHHMIRQARTFDTVLVKSRDMTSRTQTLPCWLGGKGVKTTENKIHEPHCCT